MEEIYSWVRNVVIYMILNTIIMNLLGNKSYKKYVSIASGMILVLIVISPILKLLRMNMDMDINLASNSFSIETAEFKNDIARMEEKQLDMIFADYREKVKEQVIKVLSSEELYLEACDITFDMDKESSTFGVMKAIDIKAAAVQTTKEKASIIAIEEIVIMDREEAEIAKNNLPSPTEISIKNRLSDFYNIEADNINISIQGG